MFKISRGQILMGASALGLLGIGAAVMLADRPANAETQTAAVAAQAAQAPAMTARPAPAPKPAEGPFIIKRILPISGPIKYGEWHWDETGVPKGPIVITVDLDARVLSIFQGGYEIGASAVLLGTEATPTPTGVYPITEKERHHTSNLYDAEMPYMQRLTNDGITLHASKVEWGYASHGCIGMPEPFAAKVFAKTHVGDKVYITRGKMAKMGDSLVGS